MPNDISNPMTSPAMAPQGLPPVDSQQGEINLRDVLDLLWAGKFAIALVTLGFMFFALTFFAVVPRQYQADGLVQVEQDSKSGAMSSMSDLSSLFLGTPVETAAEIEILKSRMVLDQVIEKQNLEIFAVPKMFPLIGQVVMRRNALEAKPVSVPALFRRYAWGGEQIVVSTLEVPGQLVDKPFTLVATKSGFDLLSPDGDPVLSGVIGELAHGQVQGAPVSLFVQTLIAQPGTQFQVARLSHQGVLRSLSDKLVVAERGVQSGVIGISFNGSSPGFVSQVIDDIENAYLRQNVERRSADAQHSLEFLEKQLPSLKEKLDEAKIRLTNYQIAHGSVDVSQETQIVLQQNVDLDTQRLTLVQQREEALQRFTPQHPVIKGLDQQIQSLDQAIEKLKTATNKLPTSQQEVLSLLRDQDVNVQLYTAMLNSIQELQVAKAGTIGNVRIVDYALKPTKPVFPKLAPTLAVSMILGIIFGSAFIFVQRALLRGVDDPGQVERHFGLAVLASIPYAREQRRLDRSIYGAASGNHILALVQSDNIAVEALRSLRMSLHFALLEAQNNVIMFTGPSPGLGKSFLTTNLGAVLATAGKTVVVVDADLRRGHLHQYIGADSAPGLSNYVAGDADLNAVVRATPIEGFSLVPRGSSPPNPAELLMHERFAQMISQLSAKYDYVFVDTPPVIAVADATIVGKLAGSTLLVLKSAHHPMREIEDAVKRLLSVGIRPRGVVMNQVGLKAGSYGYGNYGYTYYRYESQ